MDIFGVSGVEAEAELLSAIVSSFQEMGISSGDVGIKVRKLFIMHLLYDFDLQLIT